VAVVVEGFTFGKISDFEAEFCEEGDAFLVAPDNSRAGLVWEVAEKASVTEISPFEPHRWGVWGVSFPHPMTAAKTSAPIWNSSVLPSKRNGTSGVRNSTRRVDT